MKNNNFQSQHLKQTMDTALNALHNHTDRDSSLIAAELINKSLGQLFKEIAPSGFSTTQLFEYPAPLSNLSARADTAVAFRLICQHIHKAIRTIIRIRNIASRSNYDFSLSEYRKELEAACIELVQPWQRTDEISATITSERIFNWLNRNNAMHRKINSSNFSGQPQQFIENLIDCMKKEDKTQFSRWCLTTTTCIILTFLATNKNELLVNINNQTLLSKTLHPQTKVRQQTSCMTQ